MWLVIVGWTLASTYYCTMQANSIELFQQWTLSFKFMPTWMYISNDFKKQLTTVLLRSMNEMCHKSSYFGHISILMHSDSSSNTSGIWYVLLSDNLILILDNTVYLKWANYTYPSARSTIERTTEHQYKSISKCTLTFWVHFDEYGWYLVCLSYDTVAAMVCY